MGPAPQGPIAHYTPPSKKGAQALDVFAKAPNVYSGVKKAQRVYVGLPPLTSESEV